MGKRWEKPNLIVLYRGRPEEVLIVAGCKSPIFGAGPAGMNNKCDLLKTRAGTFFCDLCRQQPSGS